MHKRDLVSVGSWIAIGLSCWIIAWIIAEGIPSFTNIVSLIVCHKTRLLGSKTNWTQSSLFASWFSYGLPGVYWLHINWGRWFSSPRKICLTIVNLLIVCIGATWYVSGLWSDNGD